MLLSNGGVTMNLNTQGKNYSTVYNLLTLFIFLSTVKKLKHKIYDQTLTLIKNTKYEFLFFTNASLKFHFVLFLLLFAPFELLAAPPAGAATAASSTESKKAQCIENKKKLEDLNKEHTTYAGQNSTDPEKEARIKRIIELNSIVSLCVEEERLCLDLSKQMTEAHNRVAKSCKSLKNLKIDLVDSEVKESDPTIKKCLDRVKTCSEMDENEASVDPTSGMMQGLAGALGNSSVQLPASSYVSSCKEVSKDRKRDLESKKERLQEKIEDLGDELTEVQIDAQKENDKIQEDLRQIAKNEREQDFKESENEKKAKSEEQQGLIQAQKEVREAQKGILKLQGEQNNLIASRARTLANLSNAIIQDNCIKEIDKEMRTESTLTPTKRQGSAKSIILNNSQTKKNRSNKINRCIADARKVREMHRSDFKNKIDQLQAEVDSLQKDISDSNQLIETTQKLNAQAIQEREQNKAKIKQERIQEKLALNQKQQDLATQTQTKITQYQQKIKSRQQELASLSNELATIDTRPSDESSLEEISADYKSYEAASYRYIDSGCPSDNELKRLNGGGVE